MPAGKSQGRFCSTTSGRPKLNLQTWMRRYCSSFSFVGLIVAALFFAVSLLPSLLPRLYVFQGLLSGMALAIGYSVGVFGVWLWHYLELPQPGDKIQLVIKWLLTSIVALICCYFLWRTTVWQNSIRELMEMEPVPTAYPVRIVPIAIVVAAILIAVARIIGKCGRFVHVKLNRFVPRRVSIVLSTVVLTVLLVTIVNGVLARNVLRVADAMFLKIDMLVDDGTQQPIDALATGSAESLISWDSIGRRGKNFVAGGPTQAELEQFLGKPVRTAAAGVRRIALRRDSLKRAPNSPYVSSNVWVDLSAPFWLSPRRQAQVGCHPGPSIRWSICMRGTRRLSACSIRSCPAF